MEKHDNIPQGVDGLFWFHAIGQLAQPVFVRKEQSGQFFGIDGNLRTLQPGEYLIGPQPVPSTETIPVRAQSSIKLTGDFVVDLTVKKGHCLIKGINEALSLARIPLVVAAFNT